MKTGVLIAFQWAAKDANHIDAVVDIAKGADTRFRLLTRQFS